MGSSFLAFLPEETASSVRVAGRLPLELQAARGAAGRNSVFRSRCWEGFVGVAHAIAGSRKKQRLPFALLGLSTKTILFFNYMASSLRAALIVLICTSCSSWFSGAFEEVVRGITSPLAFATARFFVLLLS